MHPAGSAQDVKPAGKASRPTLPEPVVYTHRTMNLFMGLLLGMVLTFLWLATWGTWLKRHPTRPDEWDQLVARLRAKPSTSSRTLDDWNP